jgi:nucleoside-diphosphate-sugar epimerase
MAKARILITGGAGYLGTVFTEHFLNSGYEVTVLDNLMYNQTSLFHLCHRPEFKFVCGDVRNTEVMKELLKDQDIIIPLAAIVGAPACNKNPEVTEAINLNSIRELIKLKSPEQKIIFPTTNSGYGTKSGEVHCTEESPLEPISLYGKTKVMAEKELLEGGNAITLRLATIFGFSLRMRLDLLVNDFVYKAFKDRYIVLFEKDFKRNFLHIRDAARCFEHCIENFDSMKNEAYNVGHPDENISKEELCLKIKKHIPDFFITSSEINEDPDKRNYIVSNDKILKTGFTFEYPLERGIKELIKGYQILRDNQFKNI